MSLKTILVDDEIKALERLERLASANPELEIVGSFQKPMDALEYIKSNQVNLALLDIEMPIMSGLELAEAIFEIKPEIDSIFITAYDRYALEAFQANAVGYLVKPIEVQDLNMQITRILAKRKNLSGAASSIRKPMMIRCFGGFFCYKGARSEDLIKWRTAKAEELLALLIHYRGKPISKEKIMDMLWPDMNPKQASQNLHSNLYYVREIIKMNGAKDFLERNLDNYRLNTDYISCDMLDFMDLLEEISKAGSPVPIETFEKVDLLYRGDYFENKTYDWAESHRQWLQIQFIKIKLAQAAYYKNNNEMPKAIDTYNLIINTNPILEDAYIDLSEIYLFQNAVASAVQCFKLCEKALREELDVAPSDRFQALMAKVK